MPPPLAQAAPWDPAPPAQMTPPPVQRQLTFSDLTTGLRQYSAGESRYNANHSGLLGVVAVVLIVCVLLHLRQRRKQAGPPDSEGRLGRELCRVARVSPLTRILLHWVSRSTRVPVAALLVSSAAFERALATWSARPTFGPVRRWGRTHLHALHVQLFSPA